MSLSDKSDRVVQELTSCQVRLHSFIFTLLPSPERAQDVLQETNLAIWNKRDDFDPDREFWPWVSQFARLQVMANLRDAKRDRLVFAENVIEAIAADAEPVEGESRWRQALVGCLSKLPVQQRKLVRARYVTGLSAAELSEREGRTVDAVRMVLQRTRGKLLECIKRKLQEEAS